MKDQNKAGESGKACKPREVGVPLGQGDGGAGSPWVVPPHGRQSLLSARSLENISRHSVHANNANNNNNKFKRNYSLRIVRKLSRLLNSGGPEPYYWSQEQTFHDADILLHPVDVHLPKRSNTDDGARRGGVVANSGVVSRRQILSSLQEEEEEQHQQHQQQAAALRGTSSTPKMDKIHMDKRRYHDRQNYDDYGYHTNALDSLPQYQHHHAHGIRETRSLERFIPHVSLGGGMDTIGGGRFHSGYHSDTSDIYAASARSAATSKPRTIYSHGGSRRVGGRSGVGCKDIDSADMEPTPPYSRFSLSFNTSPASRVLNMVTDPVLGEPAYMRWPQPRRTKSISCSPTASSPFDDDMTLSSLSLTSSTGTSGSVGSTTGSAVTSASGKRFSRCLLLQSISKEEMREAPSDSEDVSPMTPGTPCSRQSTDDNDSNLFDDDSTTSNSDEESGSEGQACHEKAKKTSESSVEDVDADKKHPLSNQIYQQQITTDTTTVVKECDNDKTSTSIINNNNNDSGHNSIDELKLNDLQWVGTLGIGGFGRVELVTAECNNNKTFALKKMKKAEIQEEKHQQHILNEKNIMLSCSSPFVVKLYRTFRDSRYLYMLMEPCLGGELWTILRDKKKFEDSAAKFYTGCVIKAFEYLHSKGIVYRDLKPENLLLDSSGYVKLTDFGFSKQLADGEKSWTFCGTPEYVAPEMITNKTGHDQRADIWSVGILMYELLNGVPPFAKVRNNGGADSGNSRNNVYTEILKGMKAVYFPPHMSATAVELIRQLCRLNPAQRPSLAVTRKFMWFAKMDWTALENRTLSPPFLPKITGARDTSNFDNYGKDSDLPQEDFSEWDTEF